ncbi:hypothetical protein B0H14DRAFT_2578142 [Mycena olivaceomarginata]|nr:hypothetical protein B0H14DRAFT_2578142 [Mycena olivaceomarginata]
MFHFGEIGQHLRVNNGIDLLMRFLLLPGMQRLRHETNQSRSAVLAPSLKQTPTRELIRDNSFAVNTQFLRPTGIELRKFLVSRSADYLMWRADRLAYLLESSGKKKKVESRSLRSEAEARRSMCIKQGKENSCPPCISLVLLTETLGRRALGKQDKAMGTRYSANVIPPQTPKEVDGNIDDPNEKYKETITGERKQTRDRKIEADVKGGKGDGEGDEKKSKKGGELGKGDGGKNGLREGQGREVVNVVERPGEKRGEENGMEREDGREEANARANAKWNGRHGDEVKGGGKEKIIAVLKVGTEGKGGGEESRERSTQIAPRPTALAASAATEEAQRSGSGGPVSSADAVDLGPARGGTWTRAPGGEGGGEEEWPWRKEEEGRKSREEGMGSSVCILSSAADVAAIRSVESRAQVEAGHSEWSVTIPKFHKSHELRQTATTVTKSLKAKARSEAVRLCVRWIATDRLWPGGPTDHGNHRVMASFPVRLFLTWFNWRMGHKFHCFCVIYLAQVQIYEL